MSESRKRTSPIYSVESPTTIARLFSPSDMGYAQGTLNRITPSPLLSTAEATLRSPFCRLSKNGSGWLSLTGSPKIISISPLGEYRAAHIKCRAFAPYSISSLAP